MNAVSIIGNGTRIEMAASYYSGLDINALPAEINKLVSDAEHHAGAAFSSAFLAGVLLNKAKAEVPHGQWEAWILEHCTVAPRTAQAYMRLATKVSELPIEKRNAVADLPLREAIKAIATSPTAPPRQPTFHQPRREQRDRAADALKKAADAQRALIRHIGVNYIKRAEVERTRAKLQAALAALDELQIAGEEGAGNNTVVELPA